MESTNPLRNGIHTTEYQVFLVLIAITILAGLTIAWGPVQYHPNLDLLKDLYGIGALYIGGRHAIKGVSAYKAPPSNPTQQETK